MVKSLRPLLFLLFLSLPLLSLPNGGGQVPELWKKAQAFFLKNRNRLPGIVVQKSSLRVGDRRTRREGEVWIRTFSGSPKGYRWEIQKIVLRKEPLPRNADGSVDEDAVCEFIYE